MMEHDLFKTEDPDAPDVIRDRNGEVVLGLCKRCGRAEIELSEPCTVPAPTQIRAITAMKIAFDVDDTLLVPAVAIGFPVDTPNHEVIAIYRWFQAQGHHMIIWSGSGQDWARTWAQKFGLTADEFPIKEKRADVDLCFDDCEVDLATINVRVKRIKNGVSRRNWNATKSTGEERCIHCGGDGINTGCGRCAV